MEKAFWASIAKTNYKIPEGHTIEELTEILFSYISSADPELRDDIAYGVFANWLKREIYSRENIRAHVEQLLTNLDKGIGETDSDSVFLRSFSVLFLAEIVHNDNKKPILKKEQVQSILEKGLWYLNAEKDPRGYVAVKGWAHSLAHTADLMMVLAKNRKLGKRSLSSILAATSTKIKQGNNYVYIHREDERLAAAIVEIFKRGLIPLTEVEHWAKMLAAPEDFAWRGVYQEEISRAYQNIRNLLRSVYFQLQGDDEIAEKEKLHALFLSCVQSFQQV